MNTNTMIQDGQLWRKALIHCGATIHDVEYARPDGISLKLDASIPDGPGPFPAAILVHGGGWVAGSLDTHDGLCRRLCNETGCRVIAVDYRLAPLHPFPYGLADAWAALN